MISDSLTLAIVSMLVGMVIGVIGSILAVMISNDIHHEDIVYPSEEDMDQLCLWYDAEYNHQKGAHEK